MNVSITEVRDGLQAAFDDASRNAPTVGKRVRISHGKHKGKEGLVIWHGLDRFSKPTRYESGWMQSGMRQAIGRTFYRIGVDTGAEKFFTKAEYAEIITQA